MTQSRKSKGTTDVQQYQTLPRIPEKATTEVARASQTGKQENLLECFPGVGVGEAVQQALTERELPASAPLYCHTSSFTCC